MLPIQKRKEFFYKLSQTAMPPVPTEQTVNQTPNIGPPPTFIASNIYPSLTKGFSSGAVTIINNLSTYINNALFYASAGEYSLPKLYNLNFNFSPTIIPDANRDLKNLTLFAKQIYSEIYNAGNAYSVPLKEKEFKDKITTLLGSFYLNNLSQVNPTSQLSIKMGGNIKTDIIDLLRSLLNVAPTE